MSLINALTDEQKAILLDTLSGRFHKYSNRHPNLIWSDIEQRILADEAKLWSLFLMEETGGEPDVVGYDDQADEYIVMDCSAESPKGRRSICYDREALDARKQNKPENSALDVAREIGIAILSEEQYRQLQEVGPFDQKTSSWVLTPDHVRKLGGALFGDYRYGQVFTYHNGADSYYGARGFRGMLKI